jgi:hypothetical protein
MIVPPGAGTEGRARATPKRGAAGRKGSPLEREAKLSAGVEFPRLELGVRVHSDVLLTADVAKQAESGDPEVRSGRSRDSRARLYVNANSATARTPARDLGKGPSHASPVLNSS